MFSSWALRRRFGVIAVLIVLAALAGIFVYYKNYIPPSCFDNRQNSDEEGVDCGGKNCIPCANKILQPNIIWTRYFILREGVVDVAALVENPNQLLEDKEFVYAIKLYDKDGVLVAIKENKTVLEPGSKTIIFEPQVVVGERTTRRVELEFRHSNWVKKEPQVLEIKVLRADPFLNSSSTPRVEARVRNEAPLPYAKIIASAVLLQGDAVVGVSRTEIDGLTIKEERDLVFTWPNVIPGVTGVEIFLQQVP